MLVSNVWSTWNDFGTQKENYVISHDFWKNVKKIVINLQPFYIVKFGR